MKGIDKKEKNLYYDENAIGDFVILHKMVVYSKFWWEIDIHSLI